MLQMAAFVGRARCAEPSRRGGGELAVCLPVVVLLVIATIEACSAMFLKQSLTVAAYEGVRTALIERHAGQRPSGVQSDPRRSQRQRRNGDDHAVEHRRAASRATSST